MAKKYYWLKLEEDFFRQKEIKKLRKIAGGDTYTIIYQKMLLLSLQNEGKLYFDGIEEDFAEEISLEIDEEVENVKITILFLIKNRLLEEKEEDSFLLNAVPRMIGKESSSAERMRRLRERRKTLEIENKKTSQCDKGDAHVTSTGDTDIDIDIDIDIEKDIYLEKTSQSKEKTIKNQKNKTKTSKKEKTQYAEFVFMKDEEYKKLEEKYSEAGTKRMIEILDNYKGSSGRTYKDDYRAILSWVVDRFAQEVKNQNKSQNNPSNESENDILLRILKEEQAK